MIVGIMEIIDWFGMRDWGQLPLAEEFSLNASSVRFTCQYNDGSSFTEGSEDELPDGGSVAIHEIR